MRLKLRMPKTSVISTHTLSRLSQQNSLRQSDSDTPSALAQRAAPGAPQAGSGTGSAL